MDENGIKANGTIAVNIRWRSAERNRIITIKTGSGYNLMRVLKKRL
jgi:hypothetical protein